ncbi:ABC transporter family protein ydxM [Bacillus mycoides]|uniref:FtsX-like permease family protein n=1 Tax=Bacillus mycoides TaxID=1405 RepID=UPI0001A04D8E|nr:ABC transporter permease [Bacillus mycoides]EEL03843.1 ABC transporter permease protein [Bacillus cereus BDRD-ST196]AIW82723.1 ABC transporter family protein ydxM [Bacillus mycoides]GAE40386.1 putative ABC transporter permease protein [Bacillus mycoides NBRC 101238 = DSM 11821]HDR7592755.1 FtsX-like permease family protein [Bacillus mycoides]HDR7596597.1 FtsX-like permease family protein [Bacillus mycoides]
MTFWQFAFKNVTRNSRAYFAYFLSSSFSIAVFFSFAVYLFHPKLQNFSMISEISGLMIFSEVVIVLFSFFFLLYSIGSFLKVRKKQFGILTVLGISKKQLHRLVFTENMLIGILSIFFGMQFGLVFSQFFLLVTAKITHVPGIYLYIPTNAFILTTIVFLGLFIAVSAFTPMLIRTKKALHLLKTNNVKQKERKPSILISLFGAICLLGGYILAVNPKYFFSVNPQVGVIYMVSSIFVIPALVTIGTYFFFSQISFLLIYILKKRRSFYMKRINMLWISDLASRIRTNINMLFIVAMLSTVAFTMITFLYGFGKFTKLDVTRSSPFPFSYFSYDANPFANKHLTWLEQQLQKENFSYKKIEADLYETPLKEDAGITTYNDIYAMKQSDYNKLAASLRMTQLFMSDNEAYVLSGSAYFTLFSQFDPSFNRKSITLSSTNTILQVKGYEQAGAIPSNFSYQTLILPDVVVNNLPSTTKHVSAYNYNVQNWEKTYEIANDFMKKIQKDRQEFQYEGPLIRSYESADSLYRITSGSAAYFLIGTFLGVIFFIGAGSVLYFRMYTDLTNEQEKYVAISKIGVTSAEMKQSATIQLSILFFVPYVMASIHTMFATKMLQDVIDLSLFKEISAVLIIFGIVEIVFFLFIRSFYMQKLSEYTNG